MGYTKKELQTLREEAVNKAWRREKELVLQGKGHRQWTVDQQMELLTSEPPKVTGYEGSHILDVKGHPEFAGDPNNIQFLPTIAHFHGVHKHNFRVEPGEGLFDEETGEIIPLDEEGKLPEQGIVTLEDRVVHFQELDELERQKEQAQLLEQIKNEEDPEERERLTKFILTDDMLSQFEDDAEEGLSEENLAYTENSPDQSGSYRTQQSRESRASVKERPKVYGDLYEDAAERNAKNHKKTQQENTTETTGSPTEQKDGMPGEDQPKSINMAPQDNIEQPSEENNVQEIDPTPGRSENNSLKNGPDEKVTGKPGRGQKNTQKKESDEKVTPEPDPRKTKASTKNREKNSEKKPTMEPKESRKKSTAKEHAEEPAEGVTTEPRTSQSQGSSRDSGSDSGSSSGKSRDKSQSMSM